MICDVVTGLTFLEEQADKGGSNTMAFKRSIRAPIEWFKVNRECVQRTLIATLVALFANQAFAQNYPVKPVRMILPYPPGGNTDFLGRGLSQKLSELLKQSVVVDYKPGASTIIGTEFVARSAPDGYTLLLVGATGTVVNPAIYRSLPYDVQRDFSHIAELCSYALALSTRPGFAPNSVKELLELARKNPGAITYASNGIGSPPHLGGLLMEAMGNVKMTHVAYKGTGQAMADVMGNNVDFILLGLAASQPLAKAGKLKTLAIGDTKRLKEHPDLPAMGETLPGYWMGTFFTLSARAGTPKPIIDRLSNETVRVLNSKDFRQPLEEQGYEVPTYSSPESTTRKISEELIRWTKIAKAADIQIERE